MLFSARHYFFRCSYVQPILHPDMHSSPHTSPKFHIYYLFFRVHWILLASYLSTKHLFRFALSLFYPLSFFVPISIISLPHHLSPKHSKRIKSSTLRIPFSHQSLKLLTPPNPLQIRIHPHSFKVIKPILKRLLQIHHRFTRLI